MERPEIFGEDHLCKSLTGYTQHELIDFVYSGEVDLIDGTLKKAGLTQGGDIADRVIIFQAVETRMPLTEQDPKSLYEAFRKYQAHEKFVHPRDSPHFSHVANYWDPTYTEIEEAYQKQDIARFKQSLQKLIDQIIHD